MPRPNWSNWCGSRSAPSRWPTRIPMTKNVLSELEKRLATGPLSHDAPVPFFHFYGGKMQKDVLGVGSPRMPRTRHCGALHEESSYPCRAMDCFATPR